MMLSRDKKFDQNFMFKHGLDGYLKLPLSNESVRIPDDLNQALVNVLS